MDASPGLARFLASSWWLLGYQEVEVFLEPGGKVEGPGVRERGALVVEGVRGWMARWGTSLQAVIISRIQTTETDGLIASKELQFTLIKKQLKEMQKTSTELMQARSRQVQSSRSFADHLQKIFKESGSPSRWDKVRYSLGLETGQPPVEATVRLHQSLARQHSHQLETEARWVCLVTEHLGLLEAADRGVAGRRVALAAGSETEERLREVTGTLREQLERVEAQLSWQWGEGLGEYHR